jgi:hypothetical protein
MEAPGHALVRALDERHSSWGFAKGIEWAAGDTVEDPRAPPYHRQFETLTNTRRKGWRHPRCRGCPHLFIGGSVVVLLLDR